MIYFTSDLHFNHAKICEYEKESRGHFQSLDEMNEKLIENWNSVVGDKDTVYMLGDIFMGKLDAINEIMPRLKGHKVLIRGNHDTQSRVERMTPYVEAVYDLYNLKYKGNFYVLCHYPIREWQHKEHGAIHLYGHVHSNEHRHGVLAEANSYHVGVDTNDLKPVSIEKIEKQFSTCVHDGAINSETSKVSGDILYYVCAKCGKIVQKYNIDGKEIWG